MTRPFLKAMNYILGLEAYLLQEFDQRDTDSWEDLLDLLSLDDMLKDPIYDLSRVKDSIDQILVVVNNTLSMALQSDEDGEYLDLENADDEQLRERFNEMSDLLVTARSILDDGNFPLLKEIRAKEEVAEASKLFADLAENRPAPIDADTASKMLADVAASAKRNTIGDPISQAQIALNMLAIAKRHGAEIPT